MNMNLERNRQELAARLVQREVFYNVSSLITDIRALVESAPDATDISYEDDILPLLEGTDYEEAGTAAINDEDDLDTLAAMAESYDDWDDILESAGYTRDFYSKEIEDLSKHIEQLDQREIDNGEFAEYEQIARDASQERIDVMQDEPLETWLADNDMRLDAIKAEMIKRCDDWEEFCRDNDVDTDYYRSEVYEHWIVSDWLARELGSRGHVTGELCGLTLWGRQCTGQAICLDYTIQQLAMELWPDEVLKDEAA